jgi:hypothetical protein
MAIAFDGPTAAVRVVRQYSAKRGSLYVIELGTNVEHCWDEVRTSGAARVKAAIGSSTV